MPRPCPPPSASRHHGPCGLAAQEAAGVAVHGGHAQRGQRRLLQQRRHAGTTFPGEAHRGFFLTHHTLSG